MEYTAVYERDGEWWAAHAAELPGANTQGATLEEARANLREAIELVLEANREIDRLRTEGRSVVREVMRIGSAAS